MMLQRALIILCMAAAIGGCKSQQRVQESAGTDPALQQFAWLTGTWMGVEADGTITEEVWTTPRGETMFGINRIVNGGETAFFEYLCIQKTEEGIYYLASPKGKQPPTPFKLVVNSDVKTPRRFVFENPEHDFPTRIVYELRGNNLHARIEGTQSGQLASQEWTWRRVR